MVFSSATACSRRGGALIAGPEDLILAGAGPEGSDGRPATKPDPDDAYADDDEEVDGEGNLPAAAQKCRRLHGGSLPGFQVAEGHHVDDGGNDVRAEGG